MSASHLVKGLLILGERWTSGPRKWAGEGSGIVDKAVRVAMLAGVGLVAFRVLTLSWPVLGITVLVVVILALRAATKAGKGGTGKASEESHEGSEEPSYDGLPKVTGDAFLALLHEVLGAATGVHLRTLAAALTHRVGGAWEVADVRALCEAVGVPVSRAVRALGRGVTVGVRRDDLPPQPPAPSQGPPVAVVVAGQPRQQPAQQLQQPPSATPSDRDMTDEEFALLDDPLNPRRTYVQWSTKGQS